MKVLPNRVEPIPTGQLDVATDKHSEPILMGRPGTTRAIVGELTHTARHGTTRAIVGELTRTARHGTTRAIVGELTHTARHGVATVQPVEPIPTGQLGATDNTIPERSSIETRP